MEYNSNLYTYRKRLGLSQDNLATALGISRNTIGNIERGSHEPSLSLAYKIAQYFNVSVYEIFPEKM